MPSSVPRLIRNRFCRWPHSPDTSGFSLFELILVLIMISIVAAVALPRVLDPSEAEAASVHDRLGIHLRFAQAQTMGDEVAKGLRARNGEYWLFEVGAENTPIRLLGEQELRIQAPQVPDFDIVFDRWGRPFQAVTPVGNTTQTVQFDVAGREIVVLADTGFIR